VIIQVALERARQQAYIEDINGRRTALVAFGGGKWTN
jgi:ribosome modulation factor